MGCFRRGGLQRQVCTVAPALAVGTKGRFCERMHVSKNAKTNTKCKNGMMVVCSAAAVAVPVPGGLSAPSSESSCMERYLSGRLDVHTNPYEHHTRTSVWFQKAVEYIVRCLDGGPESDEMMVKVSFDSARHCFQRVMSHLEGKENAEAVILVKKIVTRTDMQAHYIPDESCGGHPSEKDVEHACDQMMRSDGYFPKVVNNGRVGACCENTEGMEEKDDDGVEEIKKSFHGYWGVVVQSKERTGVEGCYLLKAGCSSVEGGCWCTHYSVTRVSLSQESIQQQYVNSWRA